MDHKAPPVQGHGRGQDHVWRHPGMNRPAITNHMTSPCAPQVNCLTRAGRRCPLYFLCVAKPRQIEPFAIADGERTIQGIWHVRGLETRYREPIQQNAVLWRHSRW